MRNIVEQGQTSGSSELISRSRVLVRQPMDEVDLGRDADRGACRRGVDVADDRVGGADLVGELDDLVGALGVDEHHPAGVLRRKAATCSGGSAGGPSSGPSRAGRSPPSPRRPPGRRGPAAGPTPPCPRRRSRAGRRCSGRGAGRGRRAPCDRCAVAGRCAWRRRGRLVEAEGPGQHGAGVGRGADGAAVAADEGLQGRGGVHVGDRDDRRRGRRPRPSSSQAVSTAVEVGHVGHRAAGVQVGEDHLLVGRR